MSGLGIGHRRLQAVPFLLVFGHPLGQFVLLALERRRRAARRRPAGRSVGRGCAGLARASARGTRAAHGRSAKASSAPRSSPPSPHAARWASSSAAAAASSATSSSCSGASSRSSRSVAASSSAQARALGLEGRDDVGVRGRVERPGERSLALPQHTRETAGPLDHSLGAGERGGEIGLPLGGELVGRPRRVGVELCERRTEVLLGDPELPLQSLAFAAPLVECPELGPGDVAAGPPAAPRRGPRTSGPRQPGAREDGSGASPPVPGRTGARGSPRSRPRRRSARSRRRRCLSTPAASSMTARRSSGRASKIASRWPWLMITCCWRPTPVSERSSWMSSSRQGAPLIAYSLSPERKRVRVMVSSARSVASLPGAVVDGQD